MKQITAFKVKELGHIFILVTKQKLKQKVFPPKLSNSKSHSDGETRI